MKPKIQLQKRKRCYQNGSVGNDLAPRDDRSIPRSRVVEERMDSSQLSSDFTHILWQMLVHACVCTHRKRTAFELGMVACTWVIEVVG